LVLENLVAVAAVKKDGDDALLIRDDWWTDAVLKASLAWILLLNRNKKTTGLGRSKRVNIMLQREALSRAINSCCYFHWPLYSSSWLMRATSNPLLVRGVVSGRWKRDMLVCNNNCFVTYRVKSQNKMLRRSFWKGLINDDVIPE
jgi:hypothetical protein